MRQALLPDGHRAAGSAALATCDAAARAWRVEVATDFETVAARWMRLAEGGAALAFQRRHWLSAWYGTIGREPDLEPVLITVSDPATDTDVAALPLVQRHRRDGLRIIEPADAGMTDYNAPILGADSPTSPRDCARMVRAVLRALPPADLFTLQKMPAFVAGRPNPFVQARLAEPGDVQAHPLELADDLGDWEARLTKKIRGDLRRKWKSFHDMPGARLRIAESASEAAELFDAVEVLQARRIEHLGLPYLLGQPPFSEFYRHVALEDFAPERMVVATLEAEGRVFAGAMGPRDGRWVGLTRLAIGLETPDILRLSPGILLSDGLIRALHARGVRCVDFTIGSYDYKKRLRTAEEPLFEMYRALSWRGTPRALALRLRQRLKQERGLHEALRRLRRGLSGRAAS